MAEEMKATFEADKVGGWTAAKHNDRSFDWRKKAEHIDNIDNDRVWIIPEDATPEELKDMFFGKDETGNFVLKDGLPLEEKALGKMERDYYHERFEATMAARRERYIKDGHKDDARRCTTNRYYDNDKSCPVSIIEQLDKEGKYQDKEKLLSMVAEMIPHMNQESEDGTARIRVLSVSLHCGEGSIHIHKRMTFEYLGKDGWIMDQEKCLEKLGYQLPEPGEKKGRYNNRKKTWTEQKRQEWYDIIERVDPAVKIDRVPDPKNPKTRVKANKALGEALKKIEYMNDAYETTKIAKKEVDEDLQKAREDLKSTKAENDTLKEQNKALRTDNDAVKKERDAAIKEKNDAREEIKDLEETVESATKIIEADFYKEADEHFSYYRRDRTRIEKDPAVYKAFEHARKMTQRTKNAWGKYRSCYTSFGRRRWAKKAIELQQRTNDAWKEAKFIAEESKFQAAMKRQKAEIKKEINDLLKPHISDFEKFCKTYEALSEQKKAEYRKQYEIVRKKNKADVKDMSKHLTRLFGSKSAMEYDKIKEVQQDRRAMNKLTNRMLNDIKQESAVTGDDKSKDDDNDIYAIMADYDSKYKATKAPRATKAPKAAKDDVEALLEDDGPEL